MRFYWVLLLALLCCAESLLAQSAFIKRQQEDSYLIDRLDILNGRVSDSLFTCLNPMTSRDVVEFMEHYKLEHDSTLSAQEKRYINNYISQYAEWSNTGISFDPSKKPVAKTLYKNKTNFLHFEKDGNLFVLNPVLAYQQMVETGITNQNLFVNVRGVEARGHLHKRIGFYTHVTEVQERGPQHHQNFVINNEAVPGADHYRRFKIEKPGVASDFAYASGYIDAEVMKDVIHVTFGQDRFQYGDGYRSLQLGDFGANYLFLKANTRIWKVNYQNLFMELLPQSVHYSDDSLYPKKYAAMHHLSINPTKWLNIGVFESIIFSRQNSFALNYLNPVIFYRVVELYNGSPDNANVGLNFKINPGIKTVFYGQFMLDEFRLSRIRGGEKWWGNKYAFQLGAKMADPFGIKNMVVQVEGNLIRPYTYARDSVSNYTHYNQALAHPYGANLVEASLIIRYQPKDKWYLSAKAFYNKQGRDTMSNVSFGGNPFIDYDKRSGEYGIGMFNGSPSRVIFGNVNAAYEVRENLYVDMGLNFRSEKASHPKNPTFSSVQVYTGFRLNYTRRQFDY